MLYTYIVAMQVMYAKIGAKIHLEHIKFVFHIWFNYSKKNLNASNR